MDQSPQNLLKKTIVVKHGEDEFEFRIPSFKDRLEIAGYSSYLRRINDPDPNSAGLSVDILNAQLFDAVATFKVLLVRTSVVWLFSTDPKTQKPELDFVNWPEDFPVMEVIRQFYDELDRFRKGGDQPA